MYRLKCFLVLIFTVFIVSCNAARLGLVVKPKLTDGGTYLIEAELISECGCGVYDAPMSTSLPTLYANVSDMKSALALTRDYCATIIVNFIQAEQGKYFYIRGNPAIVNIGTEESGYVSIIFSVFNNKILHDSADRMKSDMLSCLNENFDASQVFGFKKYCDLFA